MNEINSIPVITVTARNVDQLSDVILSEIEHADFIAVDQVKITGLALLGLSFHISPCFLSSVTLFAAGVIWTG